MPQDELPLQNFNSVIKEESQNIETSRYDDIDDSEQNLVKQKCKFK